MIGKFFNSYLHADTFKKKKKKKSTHCKMQNLTEIQLTVVKVTGLSILHIHKEVLIAKHVYNVFHLLFSVL